MSRTRSLALLALAGAAFAQTPPAPSALEVRSATSRRVELAWTGSGSNFVVERRTLGGTYSNAVTATATTAADTAINAMETYQYRVRATSPTGSSDPSNEVTAGPPPVGFSLLARTPDEVVNSNIGPSAFGRNASMILDANDDPAVAWLIADPHNTGAANEGELWFQSWNRARYSWNPSVKVAVAGDIFNSFHTPMSLAQDRSNGTWAIAAEEMPSGNLVLFLSSDGVAWNKKVAVKFGEQVIASPSLALAGGALHLSFNRDYDGTLYLTGKYAGDAAQWTERKVPAVPGSAVGSAVVSTSLALDANGVPAIAYWLADSNSDYDRIVAFWRVGDANAVKVTDTNGRQADFVDVRLTYQGAQPRILYQADTTDYEADHVVRSDNGGGFWQSPALLPTDGGNHCVGVPFDLAVDSQGRGVVPFGRNCGQDNDRCVGVKISRSSDLSNWSTCAVKPANPDDTFDSAFASVQARFTPGNQLYLLWQQTTENSIGRGLILVREQ
ncbi:MAG: fibronectin type III domain-containing protein [Bryobacteraceae bacterium]